MANTGDSRSILSRNSGEKIVQLTNDHKPNDVSEESRIIKAWYDLIEKTQIIDTKQVIHDFDNLLTQQWP